MGAGTRFSINRFQAPVFSFDMSFSNGSEISPAAAMISGTRSILRIAMMCTPSHMRSSLTLRIMRPEISIPWSSFRPLGAARNKVMNLERFDIA
jgi:hypothetical protein